MKGYKRMKKNKIIRIGKAIIVLAITLSFVLPATAMTKTTCTSKITNQTRQISNTVTEPLSTAALFEDPFESYEDFALDFPPWTQYDGDEQSTWGFQDYEFPNQGYVGSYIIFNPTMTQPEPLDDPAHSGVKYAACFDAESIEILNDDWLITPQLSSGDFDFYVAIHCVSHDSFWLGIDDFIVAETAPGIISVSFWAKTGTDLYEPDRFQVGVSITGNSPSDFKIVTEDPYIEPPTTWTEYTYAITLEDMAQPDLAITLAGGLGVTATITNSGKKEATNCTAKFSISGGLIFSPAGGVKTVTIGSIAANGGTGSAKTMVIGIGKPTITVDVTCDEGVTASATYTPKFLFFFFLLG